MPPPTRSTFAVPLLCTRSALLLQVLLLHPELLEHALGVHLVDTRVRVLRAALQRVQRAALALDLAADALQARRGRGGLENRTAPPLIHAP